MEKPKSEIYKGYLIDPVFHYNNGKSDFNIFPDAGGEPGYIFYGTIEEARVYVDDLIEEETF